MIQKLKENYRYRFLVFSLVSRDLKVKYKGSVLGFFWSLLNPLVMLVVYTVAFKYIIKVRVENFPVFFLCAFLPWSYLNSSLSMSVGSIKDNANLVKKVYFPREVLPLSIVLSNLVQFLLTFLILIPALLFFKINLGLPLLLLPFLIILQTGFNLGLSFFVSSFNVFFSDVKHLLEIFLQIWFWLTPIIYPVSFVPKRFIPLYKLNPAVLFVEGYRNLLLNNTWISITQWILLFFIGALFFVLGHLFFNHHNKRFAEEI
jgi:ABC-2 type transport system permease protein